MTDRLDLLVSGEPIPSYAHPGDAGADLHAAAAVHLPPGGRAVVGTGVRIALPEGTVGLVMPRSGLAARHGVTLVNAPGVVDSGYRGEVRVVLLNTDTREAYDVEAGDRIAQLVVMALAPVVLRPVGTLPDTERGEGGFGSSGYSGAGATGHDGTRRGPQ